MKFIFKVDKHLMEQSSTARIYKRWYIQHHVVILKWKSTQTFPRMQISRQSWCVRVFVRECKCMKCLATKTSMKNVLVNIAQTLWILLFFFPTFLFCSVCQGYECSNWRKVNWKRHSRTVSTRNGMDIKFGRSTLEKYGAVICERTQMWSIMVGRGMESARSNDYYHAKRDV